VINRMLPEQISEFWDVIKYAIEQSLPPIVGEHPDKMNRILSSALMGKVDVWASYEKVNGSIKFNGIVLTVFQTDDISYTKSMMIYCLYGYENLNRSTWVEGFRGLLNYAKSKGCLFITAYTEFPLIVEMSKKLGADVRYHFLSFNISELDRRYNESL
jgi:hypothetical protein